jgi:hypothetical protein
VVDRSGTRAVVSSTSTASPYLISALGRAGLPIKVHELLARHSDPKLNLNVYTHLSLQDTTRAVESLPDPFHSPSNHEAMIITGTDPPPINDRLAHHLPTAADGGSRIEPDLVVSAGREILSISSRNPLGVTREASCSGVQSHGDLTKKNSRKSTTAPITDLVLLVYS